MSRVVFLPDGQAMEVATGARVLRVILEAGRPIGHACRGRGVCVSCRVRVTGSFSPIAPDEQALLDTLPDPAGQRIACLARVEGDGTIQADYW